MASYSAVMALTELDNQIKKTEEELNEINAILNSSTELELKNDKLIVEKAKKEALLTELTNKKESILSMADDESYRGKPRTGLAAKLDFVSNRDANLVKVTEQLGAAKAKLAAIPEDPKSTLIVAEREKTKRIIANLEAKKGKIEARQQRIVNRRLKSELKKMRQEAKREGLISGNETVRDKYETIQEQNMSQLENAVENKQKINTVKYGAKAISNLVRIELIDMRIKKLKSKPIKVKGFSKLPQRFKNWLKSKLPKVKDWVNNAASGIAEGAIEISDWIKDLPEEVKDWIKTQKERSESRSDSEGKSK